MGDEALIYGPYGKIGARFFNKNEVGKDALFIGGGVGIAPFLSLFKSASKVTTPKKVTLFYSTKYRKEAYFDTELQELAGSNDRLNYFNHTSHEAGQGYLQVEQIIEQIDDMQNTIVYLCGPSVMMKSLSSGLVASGLDEANMVFEDFEMF